VARRRRSALSRTATSAVSFGFQATRWVILSGTNPAGEGKSQTLGNVMNAYRLKGLFPAYSAQVFSSLILTATSKEEFSRLATADGWTVKSIQTATAEDYESLTEYHDLLKQLRAAVRSKQKERAEADRRRQQQAEESERRRKEEYVRQQEVARATNEHAKRRVVGDLVGVRLEYPAGADPTLRVIRQKLGLFNNPACMNREALFHSISIDLATFQGMHLTEFPSTFQVLDSMMDSLNIWFQLKELIQRIENEMRARTNAVEDDVRAISSRTYTYGGSGWGLVFSASAADHAVRQDEAAIRSLDAQLTQELHEARDLIITAIERTNLHEWRLANVHEILSALIEGRAVARLDVPAGLLQIALRIEP
jgi:hypothetical protein